MPSTTTSPTPARTEPDDRARRRAQEAVQEALDRRDNGGDGITDTDS